jgi:hypothetical protein
MAKIPQFKADTLNPDLIVNGEGGAIHKAKPGSEPLNSDLEDDEDEEEELAGDDAPDA